MKSKTNSLFTKVMQKQPPSASFDLSHDKKLSFNMGTLVPCLVQEVLPGDRFNVQAENFLRLAPLISPVMHKINVDTRYFFVPNRLLWPNWEDWITGESEVEVPVMTGITKLAGYEDGCVGDYLGYVPSSTLNGTQKMSALPIAAYYKIYDEYYRDQNLIDEKFELLNDGDANTNYRDKLFLEPLKRAWQHDYFTSCLPFAQKGDSVTLPLLGEQDANVYQVPHAIPNAFPQFTDIDGTDKLTTEHANMHPTKITPYNDPNTPLSYDPNGTLKADVNGAASTINTLRRAFRLQEWLEKNARGGTRMIEMIKSHFGKKSSDQRLQRPEYLGGFKQVMKISEVLSTAETLDAENFTNPVGQMAGHGISMGGGKGAGFEAEEWGYIIGIINVQPETSYSQGLHKSLTRFDRLDYAWPDFATIGEQEVLVSEVRNDRGDEDDLNAVFGYIPRYSEYKFAPSTVHGEMRGSLNFWHMAREFDDPTLPPALNEEFIECSPDRRIFAVTDPDVHTIYAHIFNTVRATRKLPQYGIPTI